MDADAARRALGLAGRFEARGTAGRVGGVAARTLYQFTLSPYCVKVRRILEYKRLTFTTIEVNPFSRGEVVRISGQPRVPVLVEEGSDGSRLVVSDSTAIAQHLDRVYPDPPVYPHDPAERALVALLEDWADERLAHDLIPFKILTPGNAERMVAQSKPYYPPRWTYKLLFKLGPAYLRRNTRRRAAGRTLEVLKGAFERDLDHLDALATEGPFLAGPAPTVFDFSVWGLLRSMQGLNGEELIGARKQLATWYDTVARL